MLGSRSGIEPETQRRSTPVDRSERSASRQGLCHSDVKVIVWVGAKSSEAMVFGRRLDQIHQAAVCRTFLEDPPSVEGGRTTCHRPRAHASHTAARLS